MLSGEPYEAAKQILTREPSGWSCAIAGCPSGSFANHRTKEPFSFGTTQRILTWGFFV